jgi:hypothetical protein
MGYYITAEGVVKVPVRDEAAAVAALKALNHDHGMKRGGGGRGDDPYEVKWYSWMPPRYHENDDLRSVRHILEMLGFEVSLDTDGVTNVYTVTYDNKTGQEDVFLNRLAEFAHIVIEVKGEDGAMWRWVNTSVGHPLMEQQGVVQWVDHRTVDESLEQQRGWYNTPMFA